MRDKIIHWMKMFVEVPNPKLGNFPPCPYARNARLTNQIIITPGDLNDIPKAIELLENFEVVVFYFDHIDTNYKKMETDIRNLNKSLKKDDIVILMDHPDRIEYINGVNMNFGKCGLLMIQKLSNLTNAEEQLKDKGYYNIWSQQDLDDVVTWRHD